MVWTVEDQLARIHRIRQEWIDQNGPCRNCGSSQNLEIDHIHREEKDPRLIASRTSKQQNLWYWSRARREIELAKCQVLCATCHKAKTLVENRKEECVNGYAMTPENILTHPGRPTIRECRICKNAYNRRYRAEKRARQRAKRMLLVAPVLVEFT